MNIEVSKNKYWKQLNYNDMILYLTVLSIDNKNDWRLPTLDELDDILKIKDKSPFWYANKTCSKNMFGRIPIGEVRFGIIPVRDLL